MNREITLGRRLAVYGPAFILLALVQLMTSLNRRYPVPDFLLVFPLLAALWTPGYDSFILGLAAGFICDYAAGRGYGPGMLAAMILCLCGNALAREGWKNYAIRGSLLVAGATLVHTLVMALFAWLIPPGPIDTSFIMVIRVSLSSIPLKLMANLAGALLVTAFFWLAFFQRRAGKDGAELTARVKEAAHE